MLQGVCAGGVPPGLHSLKQSCSLVADVAAMAEHAAAAARCYGVVEKQVLLLWGNLVQAQSSAVHTQCNVFGNSMHNE
jgi:hypothetical protein